MPWWVALLVSVSGYTGLGLVSGLLCARMMHPDETDWYPSVVASILFWPVAFFVLGIVAYVRRMRRVSRRHHDRFSVR